MGMFSQALKDEISSLADSTWSGKIGETDVTLIAKPLNTNDLTFVTKKHRDFINNPNMEGMVDMLIRKARSVDGETAAFDAADKPFLMRVSTSKIGSIFGALFGEQLETPADEEIERLKGK